MSFKKRRIVLSGYYGFDNLGDESILFSIINDLKNLNIDPIVLSANPIKTSKTFGVEAVDRMNVFSVFNVIKNSDGLISGGGSLLQDATSKRSPIYYLSVIKMANFLKKPVYFYAQGVGPINQNWLKPVVKRTLNKCDYVSVRDNESFDFLKKLGVHNVSLTYDPVFNFFNYSNEKIIHLNNDLENFLHSKPILFSLRKWHNSEDIVKDVIDFIELYSQKCSKNFLFIPFHLNEDIELLNKIEESLPYHLKEKCHFIKTELSIPTYLHIFEKISLTIGVRLHSLIFSACKNVPFIGISYDPKIDSFMKIYEKKPIFSIENWNSKNLVAEVSSVFSDENSFTEKIININNSMSKSNKLGISFLNGGKNDE